jgi:hypothetical protein
MIKRIQHHDELNRAPGPSPKTNPPPSMALMNHPTNPDAHTS